jgi:hypothetical protein
MGRFLLILIRCVEIGGGGVEEVYCDVWIDYRCLVRRHYALEATGPYINGQLEGLYSERKTICTNDHPLAFHRYPQGSCFC